MIVHGSMGTKISFFMTRFYCKRNICGDSFECYWGRVFSLSLPLHASFCHHLNAGPGWWIQTSWGTLSVLMLMWWEIAARCKYSWRQWTFDNVAASCYSLLPLLLMPRKRDDGRRPNCRSSSTAPWKPLLSRITTKSADLSGLPTNPLPRNIYVCMYQHYGCRHHLHRWQEGVSRIQRRGIS